MNLRAIRFATYAVVAAIGIVVWQRRERTIPVTLTGTGSYFPEIVAADMAHPNLPRLNQKEKFPALYQEAVATVASAITKEGLVPSEYFVEIKIEDADRSLKFELWHESAVGRNYSYEVFGDPSGKCRTVVYDNVSGKITKIYGWR